MTFMHHVCKCVPGVAPAGVSRGLGIPPPCAFAQVGSKIGSQSPDPSPFLAGRCFNEATCISVPPVDGYVMVLQPEEPKISLSGVHHFARAASEFESSEGVFLFPELRIISTITREVEPEGDGAEDPTGNVLCGARPALPRPEAPLWRCICRALCLCGIWGGFNVLLVFSQVCFWNLTCELELRVISGIPSAGVLHLFLVAVRL